jgi:CRP/FNR family transcriptional regulator
MRASPGLSNVGKCASCKLRDQSFCGVAKGDAFQELARISQIRAYTSGDTIISQGGRSDRVGRVLSGVLKIVKSLPDGRDQIIGLVHPSEFYGRMYSSTSDYSIEAATDVVLCTIERLAFESLVARFPVFEHQTHLLALRQLDSARERIMLLACQSTTERLSSYLALRVMQDRSSRPASKRERHIVHSPISRRDFAGYLSTTVETVSRNVQALSRAGVIRIIDSGTFEILDNSRLIQYSGQSEEDLETTAHLDMRETFAPEIHVGQA